jgi:hypothetical protein
MIEVRIEELVLDGVAGVEPEAIRAATEAALSDPVQAPEARGAGARAQSGAARIGRDLASTIRRQVAVSSVPPHTRRGGT